MSCVIILTVSFSPMMTIFFNVARVVFTNRVGFNKITSCKIIEMRTIKKLKPPPLTPSLSIGIGSKKSPLNVFLESLSVSKISILGKFQPFVLGAFSALDPNYHYK